MKRVFCALLASLCLLAAAGCEKNKEALRPSAYYSFADTPTLATTAPTLAPAPVTEEQTLPAAVATDAAGNTVESDVPTGELVSILTVYDSVYNKTKADPAFVGTDTIAISNVTLDNLANGTIDSLVQGVLGKVYSQQTLPLPPYSDENAYPTCLLTAADAKSATHTDNTDGTATIHIVPKDSVNSALGEGQGKMFNVITNMQEIFNYLPGTYYTWTEGDVNSNVTTTYSGGSCTVTYDKSTMKMLTAVYEMRLHIDVKNLKVLFMPHSAGLDITYTQTFPAAG